MTHVRGWRWLSAGLMLVVALPASAQDTPLALAPAKSAVVVHVKGFERTKGRLVALVKNALPDVPIDEALTSALQENLGERQLKGLPPDGSILLAMELPADAGPPKEAAAIIKVSDYAAFRDGILTADERKAIKKEGNYEVATLSTSGEEVYFINLKAYAVVTLSKDTAVGYASGTLQKGLEDKLGKEVVELFNKNDVAVFVDMAAVNKVYGEQIAQFRQIFEVMMAQQGQFDENQKKAMEVMFQALQEAKGIVLAADFRPDGLAFHAGATVGKDTKLSAMMKDMKPAALNDMGGLPAGFMAYFQANPGDAFSPATGTMPGSGTPGFEALDKLAKELAKSAKEAGAKTLIGAFSFERSIQVMPAATPAKLSEVQQKFFETLKGTKDSKLPGIKGVPAFKPNERTHRGIQLSHVAVELDFAEMEKQLLQQQNPAAKVMIEIFKKAIGEKQQTWFGHNDKANIQVTARSWEAAQAVLDAYLDGKGTVGQEKAFTDARKNLPELSNGLALISAPVMARFFAQIFPEVMKEVAGVNLPTPNIPAATEPSYLGFAGTATPERAGFDVWISTAAVKEFRRVLEPIFQGLGGIGQ